MSARDPRRFVASPVTLLVVAVLAAIGAAVLVVRAQTHPPPPPAAQSSPTARAATGPMFEGDPNAGQRVVMGGTRAGVGAACFHCHGIHGEGDAAGAFPRLAGQPAYYLYKQLVSFANGSRPNDVMTPIAAQLTDAERRDAAAYYAAARAPFRPPPHVDASQLQPGANIAAIGSSQRGVQACVGCHGPGGTGVPPDTPYLAGLPAAYLEHQLSEWREGKRTNDPLGVMVDIARRLTPEERRSVARYFAALRPPGT